MIVLIRDYRQAQPMLGKNAISELLQHEHALTVSPSTVGRVITRHGFFFGTSNSHQLKRAVYESAQQLRAGETERGPLTPTEDEFPGIYAS